MTARTRRPAVTLTEVLVALFIMAIGMIALLVMFPLGAQQIAQAIKDERSAQAGNNADAILRNHWRQHVVEAMRNGVTERQFVDPSFATSLHYMTAMENPNLKMLTDIAPTNVNPQRPGLPALSDGSWTTLPENVSLPSYPIFVDPYGEVVRQTTSTFGFARRWVAGIHPNTSGTATLIPDTIARVPRRTLNFPPNLPAAATTQALLGASWQYRYATLQDDIDFNEDGGANQGTSVSRTGRYNWSWVLQRPVQGNRLVTNMSVIVYDQRAFNFARPDEEIAYPVEINTGLDPSLVGLVPGSTTVSFRYDAALNIPAPTIRTGQWVMDGTINAALGIRNANFYRVTAVTDTNPGGTSGIVRLDLQLPIKLPGGQTYASFPGQLYVLRGVAEVFERRQLTTEDAAVVP